MSAYAPHSHFGRSPGDGDPSNRRRNWREPVVASGMLTTTSAAGAAAQRQVRVINLSAGGVGMISPAPLGVGSEYTLSIMGRPERSGRVRIVFCRGYQQGYEVGAEYVNGAGGA